MAITSYFGRMVRNYFWKKKIASFWATNGTVKIKSLNDQVLFVTNEVNLLALSQEGPLIGTDRNE